MTILDLTANISIEKNMLLPKSHSTDASNTFLQNTTKTRTKQIHLISKASTFSSNKMFTVHNPSTSYTLHSDSKAWTCTFGSRVVYCGRQHRCLDSHRPDTIVNMTQRPCTERSFIMALRRTNTLMITALQVFWTGQPTIRDGWIKSSLQMAQTRGQPALLKGIGLISWNFSWQYKSDQD